jgi:hypothetical protein
VGASLVVEADPVADHAASVLQALEAVSMYALLFERTDRTLDHAVLLRVVRCDVLLAQTLALDQSNKATARKHQPAIAAQ